MGNWKYFGVFTLCYIAISIIIGIGLIISSAPFTWGHLALILIASALITALYWVFKNPPNQDGEDRVTMLWRG